MTAAAISGGKRRSRSEGESDRAGSEHASSPAPSSRSSAKQQIRHRASIACASCRERRIRCVVNDGESECAQCRRTGATCIIKDDDERRRRPISKAYMSSLSNRIALLEDMLKSQGVVPPPAVHPPKTRQEAQAQQQQQEPTHADTGSETPRISDSILALPPSVNHPPTPPGSGDEDMAMLEPEQPKTHPGAAPVNFSSLIDPLLLQDIEPKKETGTRHLLCARGNYVHDQWAGRSGFFGPTASLHIDAKPASSFAPGKQDQARRVERLIAGLRPATHNYLMRCFWDYYNPWQLAVDEAAFEAGRTTQDARFYSLFLHICMLAIGYRFAEWDREDVKRAALGNRESTLHQEARGMVEAELERPGGIPSIQALLLLADMECGVGRDATGWMYSGMANRLAFDIGLHVNTTGTDFSELERQTRRQVMSACVMFDRKWALLLGRPTAIKMQDVGVEVLPSKPSSDCSLGTVASHASIYRQMFELLELGGKVADFQNSTFGAAHVFGTKGSEDRAYLHFVGLERLFHNWYRRLPENLTWKPVNIKSAPKGFFMLHQQFHVCMIMLHRPWAKYGPMLLDPAAAARYPSPDSPGRDDGTQHLPSWMAPVPHQDNRASLSRSMCTQHAIRVARIFWHHRQRFDGRRVGLAAIQHAGTASLALLAALAHKSAELDHHSNLRYLQVLSSAIYDMSHLYQPAARMYQLLKTMLVEIRAEMVKSGGFDASSLVGRYQGGGAGSGGGSSSSSSRMLFGSSSWSAGSDGGCSSVDRLETIPEESSRSSKRRRLSSLSSVDMTTVAPSFLSATQQACPSPPASAQNAEVSSNAVAVEQAPADPGALDLDFFHASFVDFINAGGDGTSSQDWTATVPSQVGADNSIPMLLPTSCGDLSFLSGSFLDSSAVRNDLAAETTTTTATTTATTPPPAPAPTATATASVTTAAVNTDDDDDSAVDKTIEDWLAEPTAPSAASTSDTAATNTTAHTSRSANNTTTTTSHTTSNTISEELSHIQPRSSLAHATADGTPVLRDPYVLSLETELGFALGLGGATTNQSSSSSSVTSTTDSSALSSNSNDSSSTSVTSLDLDVDMDGNDGEMDLDSGLDWSKSSMPPPPMTPVTLDELVQSVEEAVGSARARRAASAAGIVGVGSGGSVGGGVSAVGGAGGAGGAAAGASGKGESPVVRNRELDFLTI